MFRDHVFKEENKEAYSEASKKRADKLRGTGTKSAYVKRDGKHEHRLVVEQAIGRPLRSDEVVHHKDGNTRNNDLSNLQLTNHSEHAKIHDFGSKGFRPGKGDPRLSRGEQRPLAKLTAEKVVSIRLRNANGESLSSLAREHGVCVGTIKKAVIRQTWECVP